MRACRSLIYAETPAATSSKWMPWELGYVDGYCERVAIFPVAQGNTVANGYSGEEYLGIYPWVRESSAAGRLAVVDRSTFINYLKEWVRKT